MITKKHLFLTGKKQVGKSTLLQKLLSESQCTVGGFYTVRSTVVFTGRTSVHLLSSATGSLPTKENYLFFCGAPDSHGTAQRFDSLGIAALRESAQRIVMDELGSHEENAFFFQQRVLALLNGDIPVIGVLQEGTSPFLQAIAHHPNVQVVTVTEENRDRLAEELQQGFCHAGNTYRA